MGLITNLKTVIHNSQDADFENYIYTKVYSSANATVTINSTSILLVSGVVLDVRVTNITPDPNVYLIGVNNSVIFPNNIQL